MKWLRQFIYTGSHDLGTLQKWKTSLKSLWNFGFGLLCALMFLDRELINVNLGSHSSTNEKQHNHLKLAVLSTQLSGLSSFTGINRLTKQLNEEQTSLHNRKLPVIFVANKMSCWNCSLSHKWRGAIFVVTRPQRSGVEAKTQHAWVMPIAQFNWSELFRKRS